MCYLLSGEHNKCIQQMGGGGAVTTYNYVQHAPSFKGNISITAMYQWRSHLSQMLLQKYF